jgi:ubiquinol-cytochrome c reductase cytochrome c1 subunit
MKRLMAIGALALGMSLVSAPTALAAGEAKVPAEQEWSFDGPMGRFDVASVQRGFQVYKEVCSSCHSMNHLSYRNLGEPRGPYFNEEFPNANDNPVVRAIAAEYKVSEPNADTGDIEERPAEPKDHFVKPYPNEGAARGANGGALPPDLSVITKARHHNHDYIYALLTGYKDPPADVKMASGMHYNPYFSGGQIAMANQLLPDRVSFQDGTKATPEQMAKDVTTFLAWAAEPKMENRKALGLQVMGFLLLLTGLTYVSYRRIWRNVH